MKVNTVSYGTNCELHQVILVEQGELLHAICMTDGSCWGVFRKADDTSIDVFLREIASHEWFDVADPNDFFKELFVAYCDKEYTNEETLNIP